MNKFLQFFDSYVKAGFKPIALYGSSKIPVEKKWNSQWSCDRWRRYFESGSYNMGFLLGEILDVEGDTEEANAILTNLIGDTPHPYFQSHKSTHHLFLNPDKNLTRISRDGIEFRAFNHQSVVPPSTHDLGYDYKWLNGSSAIVSEMPNDLLRFYYDFKSKYGSKQKEKNKSSKKTGFEKTQCRKCCKMFFIHKKRLFLEVKAFNKLHLPWMCHGCRKHDLRESCRLIRNEKTKTLIELIGQEN